MTTSKVLKLNLLFICLLGLLLIFTTGEASASTYYIASNGSDGNNGSSSSPWATFAHAMTQLQPGDTLILKDGTYYQKLNVTVSGTKGNPITIKAENDGQAIIDGQGLRYTVNINNVAYVNIESLQLRRSFRAGSSRGHAITISGEGAHDITVKRVTVYPYIQWSEQDGSDFLCYNGTHHILFEDIASPMSHSRSPINFQRCHHVIVRRAYIKKNSYVNCHPNPGCSAGGGGIVFYHTDGSVIENSIFRFGTGLSSLGFHSGIELGHCNSGSTG